jgi:hypothetical protein
MQAVIKLTKGTARDLDNIVDIYNAEVDSGEWKPDLFEVKYENKTAHLIINSIDGAVMVCDSLVGEIDHCTNSMYEDGSDSECYQEAYRARKRLRALMAQVLELYPEAQAQKGNPYNYASF